VAPHSRLGVTDELRVQKVADHNEERRSEADLALEQAYLSDPGISLGNRLCSCLPGVADADCVGFVTIE
jgi:hypothetical protein